MIRSDRRILDSLWSEQVTRRILPNGLTLILKADRSAALASVQVWVRTGSIHEGALLGAGLSHYLEHMLFKGTARRAGRDISAAVQAHGGYINAYTTFDRTVYYIDVPSEHTAVAVDLLGDAVLHSSLPPEEALKEKDVILREIAMTQDDPDDRLWQGVFATAFREHPYRHPVIGYREVFSAITPAELSAYYQARYVPNNLVVVVVGDIDEAAVTAAVAEHFGRVPRARLAPVLVPEEPAQLAPRQDIRFEDVELTRGVLAWKVPGLTHRDAPVLDLLGMVLGHGESSTLWQELRERLGLVHSIDATCWNPGTSGLFCVSFTCDPAKRAPAEAAVERILAGAARRFTAAELHKARRQLVAGEIRLRQSMSGQASRLGAAEVVAGDLNYSRSYFERLRTVRPADLARAVRTYLVPASRTSISINPARGQAGAGPAVAGSRPAAASFTATKVANGARLVVQTARRLPNLHLCLLAYGGPFSETAGQRGASALLATLLTKDTRRRSAAEVARYIEEVGGSFQSFAGNNCLGLTVEVLPTDADRALAVLAEAALAPAFVPATLATEREAQLAGLLQDQDDVVTAARKLLRRKFFGGHPLALDAHGDEAGVKALNPAGIAALYRRLFVAPRIVLAVAGDIPVGWGPKLKAFLGKLPAGAAVPPPGTAEGLPAQAGDFVENQPRQQAVVLRGYPGPAMNADDFYVGEVADELFSGMASRLFERVREERALAYFVRSSRVTGLDAAMFSFLAGTQPGKEGEVLAEIDTEIARVQSGGVEAAELDRCHTRLKAARRQSLQTNAARAFQAGLNALQGRPVNDWQNYDARIDAVTREDLARFARTYFQPSQKTQLIVRP